MYIVILEWDGGKPPTTFYQRLHNLGLRVRGDKSKSPVERRQAAVEDHILQAEIRNSLRTNGAKKFEIFHGVDRPQPSSSAVVVQEGAIVCASHSLANVVAAIALNCGAKNIMVGTTTAENYEMSQEDTKILEYVTSVFGKKGRPTSDRVEQVWTVTCYEEGESYPFYGKDVVTCPNCKGLKVAGRPGDPTVVRPINNGENIFEYWISTRFVTGYFEIPNVSKSNSSVELPSPQVARSHIASKNEADVVDMIEVAYNKGFSVAGIAFPAKIEYLDAILSARAHLTKKERKTARIDDISRILTNDKADASQVRFNESPNTVELLDASAVLSVSPYFK